MKLTTAHTFHDRETVSTGWWNWYGRAHDRKKAVSHSKVQQQQQQQQWPQQQRPQQQTSSISGSDSLKLFDSKIIVTVNVWSKFFNGLIFIANT